MEILEAFDLTGSFRAAGRLAGCSHHTVEQWVSRRDAGLLPVPLEVAERDKLIDPFLDKIEEWVERSRGAIARVAVGAAVVSAGQVWVATPMMLPCGSLNSPKVTPGQRWLAGRWLLRAWWLGPVPRSHRRHRRRT